MKNNKNISRKDRLKSKRLAPANYLIVCEGKQTEPNYFNGLKKKINKNYGSKVDVLIPNIEIKGTGENTTALVKYTDKFVNYSNKRYGQVWVVFDKDDYSDEQFDKAIKTCDYNVAWSNPNFELWLLSHFKKVNRYISKDNVLQELSKEFQKKGLGEYTKNDTNIFEKVTSEERLHTAIKNCEYMEELNKDGQESRRNPMTKVYKIIDGLKEYLTEENLIKDKLFNFKKLCDDSKQRIYYGPPGTGKTRKAKIEAVKIVTGENCSDIKALNLFEGRINNKGTNEEKENDKKNIKICEKQIQIVQFHPSYSYNEFMETIDARGVNKDGVFKKIASDARNDPDKK